jgi:hypothetical protein
MISGCQQQNFSNSAAAVNDGFIEKNVRASKETTADDKNNPTIIAYYFHRTIRCPGCLEIESNAQRVIENSFADEIADEKLIWMPFNLDEPGGEEFEKKFDISTSTLVIAKMEDGEVTEFKKLEKVWQLAGDERAFTEYVKSEVDGYLNDQ